MRGSIPPFLQYVFMSWCSVKAQGQLYLYLYVFFSCDFRFSKSIYSHHCVLEHPQFVYMSLHGVRAVTTATYIVHRHENLKSRTHIKLTAPNCLIGTDA
jgi:hypothetical protein